MFLSIFVVFLLGGFNLEGNMVDEAEPHAPSEWTEQFQEQVAEEQRAVEALPFVKSVGFTYGGTANANKVLATVWCCWEGRSLLQLMAAGRGWDGLGMG